MGYVIDYQAGPAVRKSNRRRHSAVRMAVVLLILLAVIPGFLLYDGEYTLQRILFPGNTAVTVSALENMAENLKEGVSFSDAFHCFCLRVLTG